MVRLIAAALMCAALGRAEGNAHEWQRAARQAGVDVPVLYAIALQESRKRWQDGQVRPWPWTLNHAGEALYFESYHDAARHVRDLIERGERNVDIGAMQVSWRFNSHLAERPEHLLDPAYNLWAATKVLEACWRQVSPELVHVLACYHAGPQPSARGYAYARQVLTTTQEITRRSP